MCTICAVVPRLRGVGSCAMMPGGGAVVAIAETGNNGKQYIAKILLLSPVLIMLMASCKRTPENAEN